jgi:GNAT superfamily N-acetyltransferase
MALRLVEKRRGGQDKYVWQPFQPNAGNFNPDWWERRQPTLDDPRYVQVIDDEGDEVARIELDDEGFETTNFAGAPELGEERLEIQFFEVSSHRRGRGIGTSVVSLLTKMYPGRRLCALSMVRIASGRRGDGTATNMWIKRHADRSTARYLFNP